MQRGKAVDHRTHNYLVVERMGRGHQTGSPSKLFVCSLQWQADRYVLSTWQAAGASVQQAHVGHSICTVAGHKGLLREAPSPRDVDTRACCKRLHSIP